MLLWDIPVNKSVLPEDKLRLSRQSQIIYERLQRGSATNVELMQASKAMNLTARMTEVRNALKKVGKKLVLTERMGGGVNKYQIQ